LLVITGTIEAIIRKITTEKPTETGITTKNPNTTSASIKDRDKAKGINKLTINLAYPDTRSFF